MYFESKFLEYDFESELFCFVTIVKLFGAAAGYC